MPGRDLHQHWLLLGAPLEGVGAARVEPAAGGRIDEVGNRSADRGELLRDHVWTGYRRQETLRVRMERVREELPHLSDLHYVPGVHHRDPVTDLGHNPEVVRYEYDGSADLLLQVLE